MSLVYVLDVVRLSSRMTSLPLVTGYYVKIAMRIYEQQEGLALMIKDAIKVLAISVPIAWAISLLVLWLING